MLCDDDYWAQCVRRSQSNSVISGWIDLVDFVERGDADDRTLRGLRCALRALSQKCSDQLAER